MTDELSLARVLVPLDGSAEARRSLEPALKIARPMSCPLELVTVYDPVHGRWARELDHVAEELDYGQREVTLVGTGWAGEVIVEMAAEQPGTLVCMTAQQRDQFDRLMLGSVSSHVIRNSSDPVLLVGPSYRYETAPSRYRQLVVCLDDSPRVAEALSVAKKWARIASLNIELVHVASPVEPRPALDSIEANLAHSANTLTTDHTPTTYTLLTHPNPAESIANLLLTRPTAIAFTATHGRSGLTRLLLGSVTAELLTRSPIPLLITRVE